MIYFDDNACFIESSAVTTVVEYFIIYRNCELKHGSVAIMGNHAHDEIMDELSTSDVIVVIILVMLLFLTGVYILRLLRRQYIKYIQHQIQKALDASDAQHQTLQIVHSVTVK